MEVLEDVQKEQEKETRRLKKTIAERMDIVASLKNRNGELDEKRKKALADYYEKASQLEDAQGLIVKLTAQVNRNYEDLLPMHPAEKDPEQPGKDREKERRPAGTCAPPEKTHETGQDRGDTHRKKAGRQIRIYPHGKQHLQTDDRDPCHTGGYRIPCGRVL